MAVSRIGSFLVVLAAVAMPTGAVGATPARADDSLASGGWASAERPGVRLSPAEVANRAGLSTAAQMPCSPCPPLDGPYHIVNWHSGKCLTILYASTANNANVVQYTCDDSYPYNEDWYFDGSHIVNGHSGKCLTIYNVSTANNANAVQYTCDWLSPYNENWNEQISYHPITGLEDHHHFINGHSGKCLTIYNVSEADNDPAVQYTCDYSHPFNEDWDLEWAGG